MERPPHFRLEPQSTNHLLTIPYNTLMLTRPSLLLRTEEAALLIATLFAYQHLHYSWLLFAILFLTPDLSMLGYLINVRFGAATYNLVHTLTLPLALLLISYIQHWPLAAAIALIWTAHIAFDRLLGYGLKYPTSLQGHPPPASSRKRNTKLNPLSDRKKGSPAGLPFQSGSDG